MIRKGFKCAEFVDCHNWKQSDDTITTPNDIEIMLHYFCTTADLPRLDAPAVQGTCEWLYKLGLLEQTIFETGSPNVKIKHYQGNHEALGVYIDALRKVPLPTKKWIIEV